MCYQGCSVLTSVFHAWNPWVVEIIFSIISWLLDCSYAQLMNRLARCNLTTIKVWRHHAQDPQVPGQMNPAHVSLQARGIITKCETVSLSIMSHLQHHASHTSTPLHLTTVLPCCVFASSHYTICVAPSMLTREPRPCRSFVELL